MSCITFLFRTCSVGNLYELAKRERGARIIIKDVEPDGSAMARLNYLADRYITGDRNVAPIGNDLLREALRQRLGSQASIVGTAVYSAEPPHYAVVIAME